MNQENNPETMKAQSEKFKETARELGCEDTLDDFKKKLGTIAKVKPSEPKKKKKD